MVKKFKSIVIGKKEIAEDTFEVTFSNPDFDFQFIAGQYITVTIPSLSYLPINEQFRDFSISNLPNDHNLISISFRNSDSQFKKSLLQGSSPLEVELEGPKGIFTLPKSTDRPVIFIAGGIGITPFRSMIRYVTQNKLNHKITLFYYNKNKERAAYLDELTQTESRWKNLRLITCFGPLEATHISVYLKKNPKLSPQWFIAGPPAMAQCARTILSQLHIKSDMMKTEGFSGYANAPI